MWVGRFKEDTRGNVAVTFGITAVVLIGMVGAGVSYSTAVGVRSRLQDTLDASVLAGTALPAAVPSAKRLTAARQYFASNQASSTDIPVFAVESSSVSGSVGTTVESPFLALLASKGIPISVAAIAVKEESDSICVLALDAQASESIKIFGNAELTAANCAIQANSAADDGINQWGGKSFGKASQIGVSGGFAGDNWQPMPTAGTDIVSDPLSGLPVPTAGPCVDTAKKLIQTVVTLEPGTYCGGLDIKANSEVTLNPGIYVMLDGPFRANSGAVVRGNDVVIAFEGRDSYLDMLSQADVRLTSPQSGTYTNIQFMSDRDLSVSKKGEETTTILGGAKLDFDGVMYLPEQAIWASGTAGEIIVRGRSPNMIIVADQIWAQGNVVFDLRQANSRNLTGLAEGPRFKYGARLVD